MLYQHYTIIGLLGLCLGRILFTVFTINMGGCGGVFMPTLFIGASAGMIFGQSVAPWSGADPTWFGVIGMGAAFAGAARAPLTAALMMVELTGGYQLMVPMMFAVALATGVSLFLTRSTIYTQKLYRRGDLTEELAGISSWGLRMQKRWEKRGKAK